MLSFSQFSYSALVQGGSRRTRKRSHITAHDGVKQVNVERYEPRDTACARRLYRYGVKHCAVVSIFVLRCLTSRARGHQGTIVNAGDGLGCRLVCLGWVVGRGLDYLISQRRHAIVRLSRSRQTASSKCNAVYACMGFVNRRTPLREIRNFGGPEHCRVFGLRLDDTRYDKTRKKQCGACMSSPIRVARKRKTMFGEKNHYFVLLEVRKTDL